MKDDGRRCFLLDFDRRAVIPLCTFPTQSSRSPACDQPNLLPSLLPDPTDPSFRCNVSILHLAPLLLSAKGESI